MTLSWTDTFSDTFSTPFRPGSGQPSFDKQFVRDYLETLDWNKTPPPRRPPDVVARATAKYLEAYERLTRQKL